jgi:hypothetical protein
MSTRAHAKWRLLTESGQEYENEEDGITKLLVGAQPDGEIVKDWRDRVRVVAKNMTKHAHVKTCVLKNAIATTKMRLLSPYIISGSHGRRRFAIRKPRGREYDSECGDGRVK